MKNSFLRKTILFTAIVPLLAGCIVVRHPRRVVYVEPAAPPTMVTVQQPIELPPPRDDVRPAAPDSALIWIPGRWEWRGNWVWVSGRWERPHPGGVWVGGAWVRRGGGYVWVEGHWR